MDVRKERQPPRRRSHGLVRVALFASAIAGTLGTATPRGSTSPSGQARDAQTVATWNSIALRTTAAGPFSPPRETRALALASAAVFDAVASVTREYEPYVVRVVAGHGASPDAAVSAAAHAVLVSLYPAQASSLDAALDSALARIPAGRAKDAGITTGRTVAAAVLAVRKDARAEEKAAYTPDTAAGAWVPTPPAFAGALEAAWGRVAPFVMDSSAQFRPGPPPALESDSYERDYAEIVRIGAATSAARTPTQTEVARFWISTAPQLWNQVVRQVTLARGLDAGTAARVYLVVNLAGADAMIAAWDAKYAYNQWRPVTAVRAASRGRLTTDTAWMPAIPTPPFPDYPAGHTAYAGAAERVLSALFGEKPGELSIVSPTAGGATRRYTSFGAIAEEVVNARVWGGVHWRTSSIVGRKLGHKIGELALARAPRRIE